MPPRTSEGGGNATLRCQAPFLTSLNDGHAANSRASLPGSIELPDDLHQRSSPPPPSANIDLATSAAAASLLFSDVKQHRVWVRYFCSDQMRSIMVDSFWWTIAKFFSFDTNESLLKIIELRLSNQFGNLSLQIPKPYRDLVIDNLHDALAQSAFYMIYAAYPQLRDRLDFRMCIQITTEFATWFEGPCLPPINIQHWRIVKMEAPTKKVTDSVEECLNAIHNEGLRVSEKLDIIYRNRDNYVNSVIPIRTVKKLETFANSKLIADCTRKSMTRPVKIRLTNASGLQQTRSEGVFMRSLGIWRDHEQNQSLRQKLGEIRAEVAKEALEDKKGKSQMRKGFCAAKIEARAASSEFVAGVLKQVQEESGLRSGMAKLRTVSDAIRTEFGLGPAPCHDWW